MVFWYLFNVCEIASIAALFFIYKSFDAASPIIPRRAVRRHSSISREGELSEHGKLWKILKRNGASILLVQYQVTLASIITTSQTKHTILFAILHCLSLLHLVRQVTSRPKDHSQH